MEIKLEFNMCDETLLIISKKILLSPKCFDQTLINRLKQGK